MCLDTHDGRISAVCSVSCKIRFDDGVSRTNRMACTGVSPLCRPFGLVAGIRTACCWNTGYHTVGRRAGIGTAAIHWGVSCGANIYWLPDIRSNTHITCSYLRILYLYGCTYASASTYTHSSLSSTLSICLCWWLCVYVHLF